ncbi:MAG: hypothetical protein AB7V27_19190 [Candidatus Binatia bacterium]
MFMMRLSGSIGEALRVADLLPRAPLAEPAEVLITRTFQPFGRRQPPQIGQPLLPLTRRTIDFIAGLASNRRFDGQHLAAQHALGLRDLQHPLARLRVHFQRQPLANPAQARMVRRRFGDVPRKVRTERRTSTQSRVAR